MASLRKEKDRGRTGYRLQFYLFRKRKSVWLGNINKRSAEVVARHIDELVRAKESNTAPAPATTVWANGVNIKLSATLIRWGLVQQRKRLDENQRLCGPFFTSYVDDRTDLKETTKTKYRNAADWFTKKFGEQTPLASITPADFDSWRRWLVNEGLAAATANKVAKRVKKFFTEAVRAKIIAESPAADSKIGGEKNRERQHYIDHATTKAILGECNTTWATIFGLCRYQGFRCPTEVLALKWSDVNWEQNRLRVESVKTGLRYCPIFPEMRRLLDTAWEQASEGAIHVVERYRNSEANLRTQLKRIIERAGVVPWEKLFVNLRSSCRTDLQRLYPSHVINSWLGQSTTVAEDHYLQVTDDDWAKAVSVGTRGGVNGGDIHAHPSESGQNTEMQKPCKKQGFDALGVLQIAPAVPPVGLEPTTR